MTPEASDSLRPSKEELEWVQYSVCQPTLRPVFWNNCQTWFQAAYSIATHIRNARIQFREQIAAPSSAQLPKITKVALTKQLGETKSFFDSLETALSANHSAARSSEEDTRLRRNLHRLFNVLLFGDSLPPSHQSKDPAHRVAHRIWIYFLKERANASVSPSEFLNADFRGYNSIATLEEANVEMWRLAFEINHPNKTFCPVRRVHAYFVSGGDKFPMTKTDLDDGTMIDTLVYCLLRGVNISWVYPRADDPTKMQKHGVSLEESWRAALKKHGNIKGHTTGDLQLLCLDPMQTVKVEQEILWGGQFIAPGFKYVAIRREKDSNASGNDNGADMKLHLVHMEPDSNPHEPMFFSWSLETQQRNAFDAWRKAFLDPKVDEQKTLEYNTTGSRKKPQKKTNPRLNAP
jgi:hypothetical protein